MGDELNRVGLNIVVPVPAVSLPMDRSCEVDDFYDSTAGAIWPCDRHDLSTCIHIDC